QLIVDQRQELRGGVRIALLDGGQDARDLTHWRHRADRGGTAWWSIPDGAARRQHALENDGSDNVEALIRLAGAEADRAQDAGRSGSLDVGGAAWHEHEAAGAGLDAGGVEVGEPDGADGGGVDGRRGIEGEQGCQQQRRHGVVPPPRRTSPPGPPPSWACCSPSSLCFLQPYLPQLTSLS